MRSTKINVSKAKMKKAKKAHKGNILESKIAPEPVGAYAHARVVGNLIFLAGVGPRKRGSKEIPGVHMDAMGNVMRHDIEAQTVSVIENVKTILEESGSSLQNVVDVQVFLTDMKTQFQAMNQVYAKYFRDIMATRTTVEVGALPTPIAVEFKVIATLD